MKNVFIKLVPYAIVFIVLNFIFLKTSGFYTQEDTYVSRIDSIIESKPEVIFLGDSHVETLKLLDLSDNIGNLAFGADGINEMYIKTLTMIKYNPNLKYVFIATEPQIFNKSTSSNSTFLNKYLLRLNDPMNVYNKSYWDLIIEKVPLFNDIFLDFVMNQIYSIFKPSEDKNDSDWSSLSNEERNQIATKTGKVDHNSIMSDNEALEVFKKIVTICRSNNITLIGIRFPVNENYIAQCSKEDYIKVEKFIKELKLDNNLDYTQALTNPLYFSDEDHLNSEGIKKLSQIILKDTEINLIK